MSSMTLGSEEDYIVNQYAFNLHYHIAKTSPIHCTSLSLIRAITFVSQFRPQKGQAFSNLELAAAALSISIQLIEPRYYTHGIVEVICYLTKIGPKSLNKLRRLMMEQIDMAPKDMVHYYQKDPVLSSEKIDLDQKTYLSQVLGITVTMLVSMRKNPKENLMPQIETLMQDCLDVSNARSQTIRADLRKYLGEPAQLLPVIMRYGHEDFESMSIYVDRKLETRYIT